MHLFTAPPQVNRNATRRPISEQPCVSCGNNGSPASTAISAFNTLNQSCAAAATALQAANFGPFQMGYKCSYDCCDSMEETWSWDPNWSSWAQSGLSPSIACINCCSNYLAINNQLQDWVTTTLPASGQNISAAINSIIKIEQAIIAAGGVPTPGQQQQLTALFESTNSSTKNVQAQVNGLIQSLASFVSNYSGYIGYLQTRSGVIQAAIDGNIVSCMNQVLGNAHCGQGTITAQFDSAKATVDLSFSGLQSTFSTANNDLVTALQAAESVSGIFINLQTDIQTVLNNIQKAQAAPSAALGIFSLDIAAKDWNQLVAYATANLSA